MEKLFFTQRMRVVLLFSLLLTFSFSFVSSATIIRDTGISTFDSHITTTGYVNASDWSDVSITESQISDLAHTTDTDTWNTTEEMQDATGAMTNGTLIYDDANNILYINLSAIPLTETDSLAYNGTLAYLADILNWNYFNTTNFPYTHLTNFTDDLGNRGYTHLSNFTNDGVFITNATMNKTVSCSDIIGSPDTDFCTDATGGGAGASDQDLNTTSHVIFASVNATGAVRSSDWSNVSITESQISDFGVYVSLSDVISFNYWNDTYATFNKTYADTLYSTGAHTTDTDTWNTTEEMQDAVGSSFDQSLIYTDAIDESRVNWTNATITESQISDFGTYLTSYTETDPLWSANLTAHNTTWSTDTDTTYTAGSNLTLTGTTFAANMTSLKNWFDIFYQPIGTYLSNLVDDTTPQLSGELDSQANNITNQSYAEFCNGANCWQMYVNASDWFIIEAI